MSIVALSGCQEENLDPNNGTTEGKYISFSVSETKTKTVYDEDDQLQLNWVTGDKVRIFCDQAEDKKNAEYGIAEINKNNCKLTANADGLKWGGYENEHTFYAVYPSDQGKVVGVTDGVAELKVNLNQEVTLGSLNGTVYSTTADMSNAYMVANTTATASATTSENPVNLTFSPIMTTLKIVVSGRENNNNSVKVTGVSLIMNVPSDVASNGTFKYDIRNKEIVQSSNTDYSSFSTETIFINIKTADGTNAIPLEGGQSIEILAFLPPVPINNTNQVSIKVHTTGEGVKTLTLGKLKSDGSANFDIAASTKATVRLPKIPNAQQGNNWITPLDGDIYVSQMSIPGSHDAATGETMATIIGDMFAATQEQTLDKQWELGVRAFDLRPSIYTKLTFSTRDDELWLYHGMTRVSISWATAMNTIKAQLASNPGEFAIVLFRHESESTLGKNNSDTDFNTYMTNYINANSSWIVDWKPDLTIDEARGKVILISRFEGSWNYGCFTGWGHGAEGVTTTLRNAAGTKTATMYVQDYYDEDSHEIKWNSIQKYLEISRTFHTDNSKTNHWMINHCSGYSGTTSSSAYRSNSAYQNPKLIEYLNSPEWEGSTGIIMFDYSGANISSSTTVLGDVALQTVIDNNYKYRMKRKGE